MMNELMRAKLDALAARASRFTGRQLSWTIQENLFILGDKTTYGNLTLMVDGYHCREVYMRMRHFGLTWHDENIIVQALSDAPPDPPKETLEELFERILK